MIGSLVYAVIAIALLPVTAAGFLANMVLNACAQGWNIAPVFRRWLIGSKRH
jgi:hypothetical protein